MLKPWLFMAYTCWKSNKDYIRRQHESRLTLELTPDTRCSDSDQIPFLQSDQNLFPESNFSRCHQSSSFIATNARFNNRKLGTRPKCIFDCENKIITHLICKERLEHWTGWVRATRLKILCASLSFILLVVSAFKQELWHYSHKWNGIKLKFWNRT